MIFNSNHHSLLLLAFSLALPAIAAEPSSPGRLVIVGGALSEDNAAVHRAFLDGVDAEARIGIIPAATGQPSRNSQRFQETLVRYGHSASRIEILPLAVVDDPASPLLDESEWSGNGTSPALAETVAGLRAVWFLGGDQSRITRVLLTGEGGDTVVLKALRALLDRGGTIGAPVPGRPSRAA